MTQALHPTIIKRARREAVAWSVCALIAIALQAPVVWWVNERAAAWFAHLEVSLPTPTRWLLKVVGMFVDALTPLKSLHVTPETGWALAPLGVALLLMLWAVWRADRAASMMVFWAAVLLLLFEVVVMAMPLFKLM